MMVSREKTQKKLHVSSPITDHLDHLDPQLGELTVEPFATSSH